TSPGEDEAATRRRLSEQTREYAGAWWRLQGKLGFDAPELLDAQMLRSEETALVGPSEAFVDCIAELASIGLDLPEPLGERAVEAERLGFDLGWIDERAVPAPLVAAAWLGARTSAIRLVAAVTAGPHPVSLAEEAAVADLA